MIHNPQLAAKLRGHRKQSTWPKQRSTLLRSPWKGCRQIHEGMRSKNGEASSRIRILGVGSIQQSALIPYAHEEVVCLHAVHWAYNQDSRVST